MYIYIFYLLCGRRRYRKRVRSSSASLCYVRENNNDMQQRFTRSSIVHHYFFVRSIRIEENFYNETSLTFSAPLLFGHFVYYSQLSFKHLRPPYEFLLHSTILSSSPHQVVFSIIRNIYISTAIVCSAESLDRFGTFDVPNGRTRKSNNLRS